MDEIRIKQIIEDTLDKRQNFNQMNPSPIPNHVHNGTDAPQVDYNTLLNLPGSISSSFLLDSFIDFLHWTSVDGFDANTSGGGGTATPSDGSVSIATTNLTNSVIYICSKSPYYQIYETGKELIWELQVANYNFPANSIALLEMTESQAAPPSSTANHFGWEISGGTLSSTNADGTTELKTSTGTTIGSGIQRTKLKVVATKGTDIKYYVNDTLAITNTTNLPTTTDLYLNVGLKATGNVNADIWLNRVFFQKEY